MKGCWCDIFRNQNDFDIAGLCLADDLGHQNDVVLVSFIQSECDEFHAFGFGLAKECKCLCKTQITPAFAKRCFHILDEQIEILHIAANGAGHDCGRLGLWHYATHRLNPLPARVWQPNLKHNGLRGPDLRPPMSGILSRHICPSASNISLKWGEIGAKRFLL